MRALLLGLAASLFFASTFLLNRTMDLAGGHWIWSASLRFFWMTPMLAGLVAFRRNLRPLFREMARRPGAWLLWSTVGFGLFYAPLCIGAAYGPSWLVAGTFETTIVAGMLLGPLLDDPAQRRPIPRAGLAMAGVILAGIALMQVREAATLDWRGALAGTLPVLVSAFAYPLGNRQMMRVCEGRLDATQRALGMTLASLPFWAVLALVGAFTVGPPPLTQVTQTLGVALGSGVIATVLFFAATDRVKDSPLQLAAVEASQAGEVVFSVLGEALLLGRPWPAGWSLAGIGLVVIGMAGYARCSQTPEASPAQAQKA